MTIFCSAVTPSPIATCMYYIANLIYNDHFDNKAKCIEKHFGKINIGNLDGKTTHVLLLVDDFIQNCQLPKFSYSSPLFLLIIW